MTRFEYEKRADEKYLESGGELEDLTKPEWPK